MTYKALIFDMDGTLVDNMPFQFDAWQRFFSFHNAELTMEEVKRLTSVGLPHKIVANFFNAQLKAEEVSAYLDKKESFFQNIYGEHFAPINGLHEFLNLIAQTNIPLALATGSDFRNVNYTLDKLNIRQHFQTIVDADDVRNGKPDPESFLLAAERLKIAPEDCLVFEDSFSGIQAAYRAGMKAVALTTMHKREKLENLPGVLFVAEDYTCAELANLFADNSKYFTCSG